MKQFLFAISLTATLISCTSTQPISQAKYEKELTKYSEKISEAELKKNLYIIAGPEMEGRNAASAGEIKAGNYISNYYKELGINGPNNNYFQLIPEGTFPRVKGEMRNVMGFIQGSEKPEEILVVSAHYDHEGIKNGKLYAGADDDGSGTVGVMEVARIFREAEKKGIRPKRSILFLHVSGEEKGLLGSKYYSDHPIFPLANTIADINIDMIGRIDYEHNKETKDFLYVIGSNMLSTDLYNAVKKANQDLGINLDYRYDDPNDPNRFYYRSDHYNFAKHNVPSVFFFNGVHDDYHQPGDTPDKIEYDLLKRRTQLTFNTAWILANAENRPVVDKATK
ncbi:Peptidase family M28 [Chishuiella changwenlii]|uniref:Peptidase M28 n=1 Tax=Chishuiella changwenlii TaxID=1434701 RepID=A0A1M7C4Z9_9FLAO|nr:M20/M25/M40 family metallo-hydrolase [Chishuiella changwenlii]GGF05575.1 peptidase M28 [Chishuiella changwenlii]SHL62372.1 Peptidase family M28 [Chishuiella changwenlii]